MGHMSDFNGINNTHEETELNHAPADFISGDSLLDLPIGDNFMPIYHSFPDDIYQQPQLYASNNSTFMNNDDNRNGYLDDSLQLDDLFLDSNFSINFDADSFILENNSSSNQNNEENSKKCDASQREQENEVASRAIQNSTIDLLTGNSLVFQEHHVNGGNSSDSLQTHPTEMFKSEKVSTSLKSVCETGTKEIPKLVIKRTAEEQQTNQVSSNEDLPPLTIADKMKSGSRINGNLVCDESVPKIKKERKKHKKHKKKSRHKKDKNFDGKKNVFELNQSYNEASSTSNTGENIFFNQNSSVYTNASDPKAQSSLNIGNGFDCQVSSCKTDATPLSSIDKNFYSIGNGLNIKTEPMQDDGDFICIIKEEPLESGSVENLLNEPHGSVDFQFEFDTTDSLTLSPSITVKKEVDSSTDDFLEQVDSTVDHEDIPDTSHFGYIKSEVIELSDNSVSDGIVVQELQYDEENRSVANEPSKSSSASELIEELNAHHQQVFEEIEISTPDLELELTNKQNSKGCDEPSHRNKYSANKRLASQSKTTIKREKDVDSPNHVFREDFSLSLQTLSPSHSATYSPSVSTKPRDISSSSSSITSKSSTSHRTYRKRRRSSSSSSSCSDKDKFYNRPVKFDPVTQTYCDEFGREIRPSELKYYLHSKSMRHDSRSNNGSSSSSRSKSPRYHRKHHKSKSSSRSHRRRQHSSSCSRSRSRERRYKDSYSKKYRSPSPKPRIKRHYLDVEENMRAYEERRVMYVGDIPPNYTVDQLKERFGRFGPIQSASIKSKFTADGSLYIFGFVTYKNRMDVCAAIERGNENPSWPRFDLNFGGRRRFCNGNYTDLDGKVAEAESGWYGHQSSFRQQPPKQEDDFAELLRQEQKRLGMSKK